MARCRPRQSAKASWAILAGVILFGTFSAGCAPNLEDIPASAALPYDLPPVGTSFRDCPACPEVTVIPPGRISNGPARDLAYAWKYGQRFLRYRTIVPAALAVSRYEITVGEWQACQASGACAALEAASVANGRLPMTGINLADIHQYLAWLSQMAGARYRLLTGPEWEYAARGGQTSLYPWGDWVGQNHANCQGCEGFTGLPAPGALSSPFTFNQSELFEGGFKPAIGIMPVGSYPANDFGLFDMSGNVAEWTEGVIELDPKGRKFLPITPLAELAPRAVPCAKVGRRSRGLLLCRQTARRGGSWAEPPFASRNYVFATISTEERHADLGFRVIREDPSLVDTGRLPTLTEDRALVASVPPSDLVTKPETALQIWRYGWSAQDLSEGQILPQGTTQDLARYPPAMDGRPIWLLLIDHDLVFASLASRADPTAIAETLSTMAYGNTYLYGRCYYFALAAQEILAGDLIGFVHAQPPRSDALKAEGFDIAHAVAERRFGQELTYRSRFDKYPAILHAAFRLPDGRLFDVRGVFADEAAFVRDLADWTEEFTLIALDPSGLRRALEQRNPELFRPNRPSSSPFAAETYDLVRILARSYGLTWRVDSPDRSSP